MPFLVYFFISVRRGLRLRRQIDRLQQNNEVLLLRNKILKLEQNALKKRQLKQQQSIEKHAIVTIPKINASTSGIHLIKFNRTAAWNTPAYQMSVDALGTVLFEGINAVRLKGFYQWKIPKKRLFELSSIIEKANFFNLKKTQFLSDIETIATVQIEIYLEDGTHQSVIFDHAAKYPLQLGKLERSIDRLIGSQKLWLEWKQNIQRLSLKLGNESHYSFVAYDQLCWFNRGKEVLRVETTGCWAALDLIVQQHESLWIEETTNTFYNHPADSLWIELENGFQFLIAKHKYKKIYKKFVQIIDQKSALKAPN